MPAIRGVAGLEAVDVMAAGADVDHGALARAFRKVLARLLGAGVSAAQDGGEQGCARKRNWREWDGTCRCRHIRRSRFCALAVRWPRQASWAGTAACRR